MLRFLQYNALIFAFNAAVLWESAVSTCESCQLSSDKTFIFEERFNFSRDPAHSSLYESVWILPKYSRETTSITRKLSFFCLEICKKKVWMKFATKCNMSMKKIIKWDILINKKLKLDFLLSQFKIFYFEPQLKNFS